MHASRRTGRIPPPCSLPCTLVVLSALAADDAPAAVGLAACDTTYDTRALEDALTSVEGRAAALDPVGFLEVRTIVSKRLVCMTEPLTGPTLARIHRMEVMAAHLEQRPQELDLALAALILQDPAAFPMELVPDGHPIRARIPAAQEINAARCVHVIPKREAGWIEVDGTYVLEIPEGRAAVLQRFGAMGSWPRVGTAGLCSRSGSGERAVGGTVARAGSRRRWRSWLPNLPGPRSRWPVKGGKVGKRPANP